MRALALALCLLAAPALADSVPHTNEAEGTGDIRFAAFAGPTERYGHGALGDRIEASALVVRTADGRRIRYDIPDESVFEDLTPRIADIDGDGKSEVWVVRADRTDGGRLEGYALDGDRLVLAFPGPAIGTGFRWLNPVGIADFDGDGRNEAAYVETPHIGGILTVLELGPDGFTFGARARIAYSNHAFGGLDLDLAAIHDFDGDGAMDILVPTQPHDRFAIVSYKDGALHERWRSGIVPHVGGGARVTAGRAGFIVRYLSRAGDEETLQIPETALAPLP